MTSISSEHRFIVRRVRLRAFCKMDIEGLVERFTDPETPFILKQESLEHLKSFLKASTTTHAAHVLFDALVARLQFPDSQVGTSKNSQRQFWFTGRRGDVSIGGFSLLEVQAV